MELDHTIKEAFASRRDAVALACMDTESGLILSLHTRGAVPRDDVEVAAFSAAQLCSAPPLDAAGEYDPDESCDESLIVSSSWVHAFARVPGRGDLVVVGLAPGDANVGLLRAWIRSVADRVGPHA